MAIGIPNGNKKLGLSGRLGRRARQKQNKEASKLDKEDQCGRLVGIVSRHKADGTVSTNPRNNHFISVGEVRNVHRRTLAKAYPGGLCESSLCSFKTGVQRFIVCDCNGTGNHLKFPEVTGPRDKEKWAEIMKTSKERHASALKMLSNKKSKIKTQ